MAIERIAVEVAWASSESQWVVALDVPRGTTVRGALERARVDERLSDADLGALSLGIFGAICALDTVLADGDRVELYRPLADDPKLIRRRRGVRRARR